MSSLRKLFVVFLIACSLFVSASVLLPNSASAAANDGCHHTSGFLGFPTWYEYLEIGPKTDSSGKVVDDCAIIGPSESQKDVEGNVSTDFSLPKALPRIGLAIIDILLRVAGIVAVGFVIFGGFQYMTSQGDADALKKAQGTIVNAFIGLAISILAFTIVSFIGSKLWS